jgi:thiol-disulfide isomerase/thioredoxin
VSTFNPVGAQVIIKGKALAFKNTWIDVKSVHDYVTKKQVVIAQSTVDENGRFELSLPIASTCRLVIQINEYAGYLYVKPNTSYNLVFPKPDNKTIRNVSDIANVELQVLSSDPFELNALVRDFNKKYLMLITDYYKEIIGGGFEKPLYRFKEKCKNDYQSLNDAFFKQFIDYSIASLEMNFLKRSFIQEKYLEKNPVLFSHPEYMRFVDEFYQNSIYEVFVNLPHTKIDDIVNKRKDYEALEKIVGEYYGIGNKDLLSLVIIKGLFEVKNKKEFDKNAISNLIQIAGYETKNIEIQKISNAIKEELMFNSSFHKIKNYQFNNQKTEFSIPSNKPVVLVFFTSYNIYSIKQLRAIDLLAKKFPEFEFCAISLDNNQFEYSNFNKTQKFSQIRIFNYLEQRDIKSDLKIKSVPHALLIDQKGTIIDYQMKMPEEGLETTLKNYQKKYQKLQPNIKGFRSGSK